MVTFRQRRLGFTIIELLVVIVIIAILAGITFVYYGGVQERANAAKAAAAASQYAKIFEVYKSEEDDYPRIKDPTWGSDGYPSAVCLGPLASYPADSDFAAGECAKWDDDGWGGDSSYSVNDDFTDVIHEYMSDPLDTGLRTVYSTTGAKYRGLVYYKEYGSGGNGYITYFLKANQACPVGESQTYDGITECKVSTNGDAPSEWTFRRHGGEG